MGDALLNAARGPTFSKQLFTALLTVQLEVRASISCHNEFILVYIFHYLISNHVNDPHVQNLNLIVPFLYTLEAYQFG